MIGKLRGVVDSVDADELILDVNGVGYVVAASARTLRALPLAVSKRAGAVTWRTIAMATGEAEASLDRDVKLYVKDYLETLDIRAAKLVDANRDAIQAVAEALRVRRYLDADEVREIVKGGAVRLS